MSTERGTVWSLTINNPTSSDEECINVARQKGWRVEGQKEKGKEGTVHYQLLLRTPQVRFSAVKKQFPRAHIEIARNKAALQQYVHKEDTREGELQSSDEYYPSLQKVWDMFSFHLYDLYEDWRDKPSDMPQWNGERWLSEFDKWVNIAIQHGYVVEGIAVNPQTRSSINKYGFSLYTRSVARSFSDWNGYVVDGQTDRHALNMDLNNVDIDNKNALSSEEEENVSQEVDVSPQGTITF